MFLHQSYLWTYRFCIRAFSFPPIFLLPLLSKSKENNSESTSFFNFWVNVSSLRFVEVLLDSNIRRFLPQCITNDQCGGNTRKNQLFFTFGFFLSFVTFFLLSGVWSFRFTMEMCSILSNWCDGKVLLFVFLSLSLYFYYFLTIFFFKTVAAGCFSSQNKRNNNVFSFDSLPADYFSPEWNHHLDQIEKQAKIKFKYA